MVCCLGMLLPGTRGSLLTRRVVEVVCQSDTRGLERGHEG